MTDFQQARYSTDQTVGTADAQAASLGVYMWLCSNVVFNEESLITRHIHLGRPVHELCRKINK